MNPVVLGRLKTVARFLLANRQVLVAAAVLGWFGWQILGLKVENAGLRKDVASLEERLGRTVDVVTKSELDAALKAVGQEITTQVAGLHETIKAIPRGKDTIFIRETSRPGPPGPPGQPGAAGKPGTPLIPTADQPKAREEAIERILAWFDLGTLINCDTVGLPPSTVEFLRQPGGRILSTAPCVFRINDDIRLREGPVTIPQRRLFGEAYAGWSLRDATVLGLRARYVLTPGVSPSWSVEGSAECRQAAIAFRVPLPSVSCGATDYRLLFVGTF